VDPGNFDLVTARAVLHHIADAEAAIANLVASLRSGGALLLIEPDFLPATVAEPLEVRAFLEGWLSWARERGIDYQIGRTLAPRIAALRLEQINGTAETAIYNGGSPWADYTGRRRSPRSVVTCWVLAASTTRWWIRFSAIVPTRLGGRRLLPSLRFAAVHPAAEQSGFDPHRSARFRTRPITGNTSGSPCCDLSWGE